MNIPLLSSFIQARADQRVQNEASAQRLKADVHSLAQDAASAGGQGDLVQLSHHNLASSTGRSCRRPHKPLPEVMPDLVVSRDPLFRVEQDASGSVQFEAGALTGLAVASPKESFTMESEGGWLLGPRQVYRHEERLAGNYVLTREAIFSGEKFIAYHEDGYVRVP
jgi:hypothetical protein